MELRNEIERLTEENGYLDMVAKQALADYQKCEIANTELQELNAKYYNEAKDLRRENAELQKQVDELKANQVIECHGMLKGCDMVFNVYGHNVAQLRQLELPGVKGVSYDRFAWYSYGKRR